MLRGTFTESGEAVGAFVGGGVEQFEACKGEDPLPGPDYWLLLQEPFRGLVGSFRCLTSSEEEPC